MTTFHPPHPILVSARLFAPWALDIALCFRCHEPALPVFVELTAGGILIVPAGAIFIHPAGAGLACPQCTAQLLEETDAAIP